jgi:hypothetical protein
VYREEEDEEEKYDPRPYYFYSLKYPFILSYLYSSL